MLFVGCQKDNASESESGDPSSPAAEASLYKQWDCVYAGTRHDVIDLTSFASGGNSVIFGDSYDGTKYNNNGTYPGRVDYNSDNLSGTIGYNGSFGAQTLEFKNLTATTCDFKVKLLGDMVATFHTYSVSNHTLE